MKPLIRYSPALQIWCCVGSGLRMCAQTPDAAFILWQAERDLRAAIGALA